MDGDGNFFIRLADRVWDGPGLSRDEALAVLRAPDEAVLELLAAAYRLRFRAFGRAVHLNYLINAKSGRCGEDCGYCSQSRVSTAPVAAYPLVSLDELIAGASRAAEHGARTYCMATSGRQPSSAEWEKICAAVREIKQRFGLKLCVSPGLLSAEQARQLREAGADRVNHNLNTSRAFYARICTTHDYDARRATIEAARAAGLELCSGGIVGMGESDEDVVDLALELGALKVEALPVNFFQPITGTPLGDRRAAEGVATVPLACQTSDSDTEAKALLGECGDRGDSDAGTSDREGKIQRSASSPSAKGERSAAAASAVYGDSSSPQGASSPKGASALTPIYCLKVLALFRLANPRAELRIAAGRQVHLRSLQPLGLFAANSIFVGDYLTTRGGSLENDRRMLDDLGFSAVIDG